MLQFLLDSEFSSVETMAQVTQLTTPAPKKSVADLEETLRTMTSVVKGSSGRRWIRGEAIGRGSLGTVFQAMDQQTGELLAVKEGSQKMNGIEHLDYVHCNSIQISDEWTQIAELVWPGVIYISTSLSSLIFVYHISK